MSKLLCAVPRPTLHCESCHEPTPITVQCARCGLDCGGCCLSSTSLCPVCEGRDDGPRFRAIGWAIGIVATGVLWAGIWWAWSWVIGG